MAEHGVPDLEQIRTDAESSIVSALAIQLCVMRPNPCAMCLHRAERMVRETLRAARGLGWGLTKLHAAPKDTVESLLADASVVLS